MARGNQKDTSHRGGQGQGKLGTKVPTRADGQGRQDDGSRWQGSSREEGVAGASVSGEARTGKATQGPRTQPDTTGRQGAESGSSASMQDSGDQDFESLDTNVESLQGNKPR